MHLLYHDSPLLKKSLPTPVFSDSCAAPIIKWYGNKPSREKEWDNTADPSSTLITDHWSCQLEAEKHNAHGTEILLVFNNQLYDSLGGLLKPQIMNSWKGKFPVLRIVVKKHDNMVLIKTYKHTCPKRKSVLQSKLFCWIIAKLTELVHCHHKQTNISDVLIFQNPSTASQSA